MKLMLFLTCLFVSFSSFSSNGTANHPLEDFVRIPELICFGKDTPFGKRNEKLTKVLIQIVRDFESGLVLEYVEMLPGQTPSITRIGEVEEGNV